MASDWLAAWTGAAVSGMALRTPRTYQIAAKWK